MYDIDGYWIEGVSLDLIEGMSYPVQCARCHTGVYDLGKVEVTARYTDCSMWKAPCCGVLVDDRGETGWLSRRDYYRLDADGMQVRR